MNNQQNRRNPLKSVASDLIGVILLGLFLLLFFNIDRFKSEDSFITIPESWQLVNTIFLSIVIEAVPFILLGVFMSALIQIYVKEETIQRYLPKNAFAALLPAALMGTILPICECAIIPVVRRLIKKGMPLHVGVVFLIAAPILNPIVFASTFFAFRTQLEVLYWRMGLGFFLAIVIGAILYLLFKQSNQLKWSKEELVGTDFNTNRRDATGLSYSVDVAGETSNEGLDQPVRRLNRFKQTMYHATDEFFLMGKYLIIGAFIAACFQTFMDRQILLSLGSDVWSSTLVMMAFAYILSLCSEADAFVAASFGGTFTIGSLIAFLVYGPMLDLKNTIMLFAFFRAKFVIGFMVVVTVVVFSAILLLQFFIL